MGYTVRDKINEDIRLKQKRKKIKKGGTFIERELYQSEAFLSLNKNAMKFVIALLDARWLEPMGKAKSRKGKNRQFINLNNLEVSYGILEKVYKIPRSSIPRAIDDAMAKGFCGISHHGGAYRHDKSEYKWSDNYLLWRPGAKPFQKRPRRERHGYQGRRLGATKETSMNELLITADRAETG